MVLIDREGNILQGWLESWGPVRADKESPYRSDFVVCLRRTDTQISQWKKILDLKNQLSATDYQPNKYIEGEYTEEEWEELIYNELVNERPSHSKRCERPKKKQWSI